MLELKSIKQKEFNSIIESSKVDNTDDIKQYFSESVADALLPITKVEDIEKEINRLIENIEQTTPWKKSFSIGLGRRPDRSKYGKKDFMLKKEGEILDIADVVGINPLFIADEDFGAWADIFHPSNKWINYNKDMLNNPEANHSIFTAYLTRFLGRCRTYTKIRDYKEDEQISVSRLFAVYICRDLIDKWFPVLEWFSSLTDFNDFVNLNIIRATFNSENKKSINFQNLLATKEIYKILESKKT